MGQFEAFVGVNLWTALFTLLNTLTIFFVAKKFLFGPVMKIIRDRQKEIDDMYAQADQSKQQAEKLQSEYEDKLSVATQTSDRLVKEAMARGKNREEEIVRAANREADAIRQKAAEDIAREKKKALNDAKDEISSIAMDIAEKVVGATLDSDRQQKLVDSFLEELGEQV
ncbi:MAG: F0F1 ATP synthase subunit B [Oscillospiraceae bacterium]|nr:F0F1 ATP synthase subunit B [Oscillospiraceae bacterium]